MKVVMRCHGLVDVRLLFVLYGHGLEGRGSHRLILGEVHEREALVVASRGTVCCNKVGVGGGGGDVHQL